MVNMQPSQWRGGGGHRSQGHLCVFAAFSTVPGAQMPSSKCLPSEPNEWTFCHWLCSFILWLVPRLSLKYSCFHWLRLYLLGGCACFCRHEENASTEIALPQPPSSQQRSLFVPRADPPTTWWRCRVRCAKRALRGEAEGKSDGRL